MGAFSDLTMGEVVVGISGASGAVYGQRLVEVLTSMGKTVRLIVTDSGRLTLKHECNTTPEALAEHELVILEDARNVGACLLYTSPSPRDQRGSRMPSSA